MPDPAALVDDAVARARGVVGLYGDPTVSWSIGLDLDLARPVGGSQLEQRAAALVARWPHLGRVPPVVRFGGDDEGDAVRAAQLDRVYGDQDPLLRIAVGRSGSRLLLAAHHGAVDGLGLLAVVSDLLADQVQSTASGIGGAPPRRGFVLSSAARLAEAVVTPPSRLAQESAAVPSSPVPAGGSGDVTARRDQPVTRIDTAQLLAGAATAVAEWNAAAGRPARRLVAAVGASRRDGGQARPDRDTAYLRVRLPADLSAAAVRAALAATAPEPAFPERRSSGWAALATRALRSRLGSSLLVSNLGLVVDDGRLRRIAFYPSAAGRRALAVGLASTASTTTVTVRMPRADFSAEAAERLCAAIARTCARPPAATHTGPTQSGPTQTRPTQSGPTQ